MNARPSSDNSHAIEQIERRLEVRRHRLERHVEELAAAARDKTRPLPLLGLAAFAVAGFALARSQFGSRPAPRRGAAASVQRAGLLSSLLSVVKVALQIAGSPLIRRGWEAYRHRHHYR